MRFIIFLDPHNCLAVSDSVGNIFFYAVTPSKIKNKLIKQKLYKTTPLTKNNEEQFPATAIAFNNKNKYFLLGDEFGNVTFWDLS